MSLYAILHNLLRPKSSTVYEAITVPYIMPFLTSESLARPLFRPCFEYLLTFNSWRRCRLIYRDIPDSGAAKHFPPVPNTTCIHKSQPTRRERLSTTGPYPRLGWSGSVPQLGPPRDEHFGTGLLHSLVSRYELPFPVGQDDGQNNNYPCQDLGKSASHASVDFSGF